MSTETTTTSTPGAQRVWLLGRDGSPAGYRLRDFLQRSVVEFDWTQLHTNHDAAGYGFTGLDDPRLPMCVLPDGTRIESATIPAVAGRLGWITHPQAREYDVSIYGAGPAGLSAAVSAASEGLRTVLLERDAVGGQAATSSRIENFLGFPGGISGAALAERARQQAVDFGAEILLLREGVNAEFHHNKIHVDLADGTKMTAATNLCATGIQYRRLDLPHEDQFLGAGLYYGAGASEARLCAAEDVYIIGGGNSAGQAALHLAKTAHQVILLIRGQHPAASMSSYLLERLAQTDNIELHTGHQVTALDGDTQLRAIIVRGPTGTEQRLDTRRLFVLAGGAPNTDWAKDTGIIRDPGHYLITGPDLRDHPDLPTVWPLERDPYYLETSVPGSFAAGDVRHGAIKRVASAVGEGAMAVQLIHQHLNNTHR
ncbi:NAD(P)/FAD-dependent oxidoreductase [Arthrobacter monumenti]